MIAYKYPEEKDIILHYAIKLQEPEVTAMIKDGFVKNSNEAMQLASFF